VQSFVTESQIEVNKLPPLGRAGFVTGGKWAAKTSLKDLREKGPAEQKKRQEGSDSQKNSRQ